MDCPICFNNIKNSAIGSCTHHFCLPCLIKWCQYGGLYCPICKLSITEIRPDKEFDGLLGNDDSILIDNNFKKIIIKFNCNERAGITLQNNYTSFGITWRRAPGVIISKIRQQDKCYKSGLRNKDVLLFINNIPCADHKQTIEIINKCVEANMLMTCELLRYKHVR